MKRSHRNYLGFIREALARHSVVLGSDTWRGIRSLAVIFVRDKQRGWWWDADLIAAAESGTIAGAVLDVLRVVPLPADHPFWSAKNIVVLPHVGGVQAARVLPVLLHAESGRRASMRVTRRDDSVSRR